MLKKLLEDFPSLSALAFIWREKLGDEQFVLLQKNWLKPMPERPRSHLCARCNRVHKIHWRSDSDIVSVPPEDSYCKRQALSFEDVCLLHFDVPRFTEQLCNQLAIIPDKKADLSRFPCRTGWVEGAHRQYPVYVLLGDPSRAEQAAKNLLVEEESPFVLLASADLPELFQLFKKKKCVVFPLLRIAGITSDCVKTIQTGSEFFAEFLCDAEGAVYVPAASVKILDDYARIVFPDEHIVHLTRATVRRSVVRFIHQWVKHKNDPVFDIDIVRAAYDEKHPDLPWTSRRFKEDLFKRHEDDFDRLFHSFPGSNRRYRLKI
jgi:hypothetical protein